MSARTAAALLLAVIGMLALGGAWNSAVAKSDNANGGANQQGPYDPHNVGQGDNQGNGNAPCNGCVGNADDKNPPGQQPGGNDHNKGYECDGNKGVGDNGGNPAHSSCSTTPTTAHTTTTFHDSRCTNPAGCEQGCTANCGGCVANCGGNSVIPNPPNSPNAEVLGLTEEAPAAPAVAPSADVAGTQLAFTGATSDVLGFLAVALVAFGMAFILVARKPKEFAIR